MTEAGKPRFARKGRLAAIAGGATTGIMALALFLSGPASAQSASLFSGSSKAYVTASASSGSWLGAVSVKGTLEDHNECASVYEQGQNEVTGYGAWQYEGELCNTTSSWYADPFSFTVSDYYSDSVAIKVCDGASTNCRSEHVWH
jgi:hypothetical protein